MRHIFGHWSIDERAEMLVRDDGKSLRFVDFVEDSEELGIVNRFDRRWMRFEADPGDRPYALLVECRDVAPVRGGNRELIWRLDHLRSARLNGFDRPQYERWRAIDLLACEALVTWPARERTGLRPVWIASSGGVEDGQWAPNHYRVFSIGSTHYKPNDSVFPDPVIERPRVWRFEPARETASAAREIELLRALIAARPDEIYALVEALLPTRPHLTSGDRIFLPFAYSTGIKTFWMYVDDELITDRLQTIHSTVAGSGSRWSFRPPFAHIIGSIDRRQGAYVDFDRLTSFRMTPRRREGAMLHEHGVFSSAQDVRFREVVEEAIWSWRDCSIVLPDVKGDTHTIIIDQPSVAEADRLVHYGGRVSSVSMTVARSLADSAGNPLSISTAFAEISDRPPPKDALRFGRFEFDPARNAMIDPASGQSLTFEASLDGGSDANQAQRGLFRYRDAEGDWPIHVRRDPRTQPYAGAPWTIDYVASSGKSSSRTDEIHWRRIHFFTFEALLLWPDSAEFGPGPASLLACGGWANGKWEPLLRRERKTGWRLGGAARHVSEPSCEAPRRWTVVTGPPRPRSRSPLPHAIAVDIDADSRISVPPVDLKAFAARNLSDHQYLKRQDDGALFYLCGHRTVLRGPDGEPEQEPIFQYCDEDVRVRLHAANIAYVYEPRIVMTSAYHEEDGVLPSALFRKPLGALIELQEILWKRLAEATETVAFGPTRGRVQTTGVYVAGVIDSNAVSAVWTERKKRKRT